MTEVIIEVLFDPRLRLRQQVAIATVQIAQITFWSIIAHTYMSYAKLVSN